jgi:GAF domain-containing protein
MGRFPLVEKEIVSEEKDKPVLDEQTLAKLLEAAYVLQEHNRELQEMELGLDLKRDQLEAEERSAHASTDAASRTRETAPPSSADYTSTLAEIVGTQHQIQVRHLELEPAMSLVAARLTQMARASGAAIGILESKKDGEKDDRKDGKKLRYRAAAGSLTLPAGTEVPMEKALCLACLRTGQVLRCADVNPEFLLDTEECRRRGIQSLIAVPIFHDGGVAGGLELYYPNTQAFTEQDVHTCQLMAGLVTEALGRDEELTLKKSLASERAVMLEALERLKPNLAALVDQPAAIDSTATSGAPATAASASVLVCRKCGHRIVGEEQFCGNCGTPRIVAYEAPSMQSREASLRNLQETMKQEALKKTGSAKPASYTPAHHEKENGALANDAPARQQAGANPESAHSEKSLADALEEEMPELFAAAQPLADPLAARPIESTKLAGPRVSAEFEDSILADLEIPLPADPADEITAEVADEVNDPQSKALANPERTAAWSSAANARDFLEQLASARRPGALARFWNTRRGDIYLAIAVILVAVVIRWGIWSSHSVSATGNAAAAATHRKPAPDADLPLFDRMLISLGLAEPPAAPEYKGNPDTQVWVDLHTALYYCPGADLYGKTPKGKFATQRDAQLDQFEPAYRKACD